MVKTYQMKIVNIIALILSILLIGISLYYIEENLTEEGGLLTFPFFLFFFVIFIANFKRAKGISIMGILFSLIMMAWDGAMIDSPSHISFDEVGIAWIAYAAICILFFSILIKKATKLPKESTEIIDDMEMES